MRCRHVLLAMLPLLMPRSLHAGGVGHPPTTASTATTAPAEAAHVEARHHDPDVDAAARRTPRPSLVKQHGPVVPAAFGVGLLALLGSLYARSRGDAGEPTAPGEQTPSSPPADQGQPASAQDGPA